MTTTGRAEEHIGELKLRRLCAGEALGDDAGAVTAHAADESRSLPPCSLASPLELPKRARISSAGAPPAIALPSRSPETFSP